MIEPSVLTLLVPCVLVVAFLYSSVGHAGASGYIAVMLLCGVAPALIKPVALSLNILVASIASYQFWRAGHFSLNLLWPFAAMAIPAAFLGGYLELPAHAFKVAVGLVLLASAAHFLLRPRSEYEPTPPTKPAALGTGAALGLMAGLTGTGGGIFLTPLVITLRWARTKTASAISAAFILCNSIAGLTGNFVMTKALPPLILPLAVAVVVGGIAGSWLGAHRLPHATLKRLLAGVLIVAGGKLVFTA